MSIMICDRCDAYVDTDYDPMSVQGNDVICENCLDAIESEATDG